MYAIYFVLFSFTTGTLFISSSIRLEKVELKADLLKHTIADLCFYKILYERDLVTVVARNMFPNIISISLELFLVILYLSCWYYIIVSYKIYEDTKFGHSDKKAYIFRATKGGFNYKKLKSMKVNISSRFNVWMSSTLQFSQMYSLTDKF